MGANEKSDYQAEFFPDAVSEEERKLFLRNNFRFLSRICKSSWV